MLKTLYLLRHGLAVPHGTPDMADEDRPLTPEGEARTRQVGLGLRKLGVRPDQILASPLPRARATAEIVAEALKIGDRVGLDDALQAHRTASEIADWLKARDVPRLMIVGHNPNLSELLGLLLTPGGIAPGTLPFELRKAGVAAVRVGEDGTYRLDWMIRPTIIRRLRG